MKAELSGNIYRFHLGAGLGLDAYCQLLDFSDISTFDGKKITVFKLLDNTDSQNTNIEEIKACMQHLKTAEKKYYNQIKNLIKQTFKKKDLILFHDNKFKTSHSIKLKFC